MDPKGDEVPCQDVFFVPNKIYTECYGVLLLLCCSEHLSETRPVDFCEFTVEVKTRAFGTWLA